MFEAISEKFQSIIKRLSSPSRLTEKNIKEGLREIRTALLEADVNYKVVKEFIKNVSAKAVGEDVIKSVSPGQQIVKIVKDELTKLMGPVDHSIKQAQGRPTVIMMAGLQGCGKTTTCGKLAKYLLKKGQRPLLVAADVQRPAAIEQLQVLGQQLEVPVYAEPRGYPPKICKNALKYAEKNSLDPVILDTAGRLQIDQELMRELSEIARLTKPDNIFLVCDAMTGQDAVNSAKGFNDKLALDGVILTKLDGDARSGAALSIKAVTGKPIKFVGLGEKLDRLEEFHPERIASRILGMGDIVSLVEKAQEAMDQEKAEEMADKLLKGTFTFGHFLEQLQMIKQMGSIKDLLAMIPGFGGQLQDVEVDDDNFRHIEAIIYSMTPEERHNPDIIDGRRRARIARGSGRSVQDVNMLLRQFKEMRKMMKDMGGGRMGGFMSRMMPGFGGGRITRHGENRKKKERERKKKKARRQRR